MNPIVLQYPEHLVQGCASGDGAIEEIGCLIPLENDLYIVPAFQLPHDLGNVGVIEIEPAVLPGDGGIDIYVLRYRDGAIP